jgi:hypothetical protein
VFLKPIDAGDVSLVPGVAAHYDGQRYKAFQSVTAVTEAVLGEFYWEVRAGEMAQAVEYVAPPYSVSEDATSNEVTYTFGEYLPPSAIEQAFKLKEPLSVPQGVAPSQPNPYPIASAWKWAGIWGLALVALFTFISARAANEPVLDMTVQLEPEAQSGQPSAMHFSEPFVIHKSGNVRADVSSPVNNDWIGVQGDLVNQDTGAVRSFYQEISYYHGQDSDGSWSEGGTEGTEYLSSVAPGTYVLRTTAAFASTGPQARAFGRSFRIQLTSDTPRALWFFFALVAVLVGPLLALVRFSGFETTRWADSNLSQSQS